MRLRNCWIPPNSAQGRRVWRGGRPQKQALLHPLRSIQGSCCWTVISSPASTQQRIHWIPKYELFSRSDIRIRGHATMSSLAFLHYLHYMHYIIAVVCPHHHIMHDVRTHTHTHPAFLMHMFHHHMLRLNSGFRACGTRFWRWSFSALSTACRCWPKSAYVWPACHSEQWKLRT